MSCSWRSLTVARKRALLSALVLLWVCVLQTQKAHALVLTSYFEAVLVKDVSTTWMTVSLDNTYTNAIPVCTYVLGTFAGSANNYTNPPAVTRIRNIGTSSFQLRIQGWEDAFASTANVHCMVMDEGAHIFPDGRLVEAHSVLSDQTSGQNSTDGGWNQSILENVSSSIVHNYSSPAVFGQIISHNDSRASVIYVSDCDARQNHPFQSGMADGMCVGKHIGAIPSSRDPETIGYIVAESGSGTVNNVFYELALGPDSVGGNNNSNSGFNYNLSTHHTVAVLTQAAEDGGNGSWAVLYGNSPLTANAMRLAVDEEEFAGDASRNHTKEPVYYWAFSGAEITLIKNLISDSGGSASLSDFILSAVGPSTVSGISGTSAVTKTVVQPGTYQLSETNVPGYIPSNWACANASSFSGDQVQLNTGDYATCTIVNNDEVFPSLTLVKQITNDGAGTASITDFTLNFSGNGISRSGVTGDASITSVVVPSGSYVLGEISAAGYVLENISCDGSDVNGNDGVDLQAGENVTCYLTNNDQTSDLSIVKTVNNAAPNLGATLTFTLSITNAGPDTASDINVLDPLPAGFSYVASSITGGDVRDDSAPAGPGLNWTINSLPANASTSLTFQATVLAP